MMSIAVDEVISELLAKGYSVRFTAQGDSMDPIIRSGDVLQIDPLPAGLPRRGDVVLTNAPRGLTAHRVVAAGAGSIITRGDRASEPDAPVSPALLMGRVTWLERNGRRLRVRRLNGVTLAIVRFAIRAARRVRRSR